MLTLCALFAIHAAASELDRVPASTEAAASWLIVGAAGVAQVPTTTAWAAPTRAGGLDVLDPRTTGAAALTIGALTLGGHAELSTSIPWLQLPVDAPTSEGIRAVGTQTRAIVGARVWPWALRAGTLRPMIAAEWSTRSWWIRDVPGQDAANSGPLTRRVIPLGLGVAARPAEGWALDLAATWAPNDRGRVLQVVDGAQLDEVDVDLSALRVTVGIKAVLDVGGRVRGPTFRQAEAERLEALVDARRAAGPALAVGAVERAWRPVDPFLASAHPELAQATTEALSAGASLGWSLYRPDLELRVAWRALRGTGGAYGSALDEQQHGVFAEAIRRVNLHRRGFVPWFGAGAGVLFARATVSDASGSRDAQGAVPAPTAVFGLDLRPAPAAAWHLRSGARVLPWAPLVVDGSRRQLGGVELDLLQIVVLPTRLFHPS